jgi:hypothetical protein
MKTTRGANPGTMAGWQSAMRAALDGDTQSLDPDDAEAMRETVVAAARDSAPQRSWRRPLAIAATVVLIVGAGAAAGRRFEPGQPPAASPVEHVRPAGTEQLQLQFATPGGTRIIWIFNPDLDLKAMIPWTRPSPLPHASLWR